MMKLKIIPIRIYLTVATIIFELSPTIYADENNSTKYSVESKQSRESIIFKELETLRSKIDTKKISLEEARTQYYEILAKCPETTSNQLDKSLKKFAEFIFEIYRDEKFKEGNLIFGHPANYWLFLKTEKRFFDFKNFCFMRRIQYKISSHAPSEEKLRIEHINENTIEQSVISLLDEEGFEIFQFTAGLLCDARPSLGFFDISEKKYKEITGIAYKSFK